MGKCNGDANERVRACVRACMWERLKKRECVCVCVVCVRLKALSTTLWLREKIIRSNYSFLCLIRSTLADARQLQQDVRDLVTAERTVRRTYQGHFLNIRAQIQRTILFRLCFPAKIFSLGVRTKWNVRVCETERNLFPSSSFHTFYTHRFLLFFSFDLYGVYYAATKAVV